MHTSALIGTSGGNLGGDRGDCPLQCSGWGDIPPNVNTQFVGLTQSQRLLIVSPASSAEPERSFSALRRLKTWMRSTMSQTRLNAVALCHVHQDILDAIDIAALVNLFVSHNDTRLYMFGD